MGKIKKQEQPVTRAAPMARGAKPLRHRRVAFALVAILALGLAVRAAYLVELTKLPDFDHPLVDADYHDYWARSLVAGRWAPPENEPDPHIGTTPYFRPPGYPFFLAAVYRIFGTGYLVPRIVQMLLGLASALLLFMLARRLFDGATGAIAAGLMTFYWIFIYFEGEFLEPVLSVPLIIAFVWMLVNWRDRPSPLRALGAGVLLGLLSLVRPNALVLIPVAAVWVYWVARVPLRGSQSAPRSLRSIVLLVAGTFAVILPVTIRNYAVSGDFVLISSNAGINLLIGNSARADGEVRGTIPGIGTLDTSFDYPEIVRRVEQLEGRPMSYAEVGRDLTARALRRMAANPGRTVRLMLRKTLLFWGPDEVADNKVIALDRSHSRVLHRIPLSFPLVLSLGILGLVAAWRRRRIGRLAGTASGSPGEAGLASRDLRPAIVLIFSVVMVWFASHLPVAVTARYRVPVIPFLILFAAFFVRWIAAVLRDRRFRIALPWLVATGVLLASSHVDLAGYKDNKARWHYQRAIAYQHGGHLDQAIQEYRAALRLFPDYAAVYNDIAAALATQGRMSESVPYFRRAVQLNPDDPSVHLNLAMALEALGRREESHRHYREVLRLDPSNPDARAGLQRTRSPGNGPPDARTH
jgi:hypothetical protein